MSQFIGNVFSKYQFGFRKSLRTLQCLLAVLEKLIASADYRQAFGALLPNLWNCIYYDRTWF